MMNSLIPNIIGDSMQTTTIKESSSEFNESLLLIMFGRLGTRWTTWNMPEYRDQSIFGALELEMSAWYRD